MAAPLIFFVESPAAEQRILLCRWVEGFHAQKKRIQIATDSTIAAQHLDAMLWNFSQESFIPHGIAGRLPVEPLPNEVWITIGELFVTGCQILVADCPVGLDFMKRFRWSVHFVVMDDPQRRQESRLLWQKARDEGLSVRHVAYRSGNAIPILDP